MPLTHTTPDPVEIHRPAGAAEARRRRASRHRSLQPRPGSVSAGRRAVIAACGFTNITRDHMDYHADLRGLPRGQAAAVHRSGGGGRRRRGQCRCRACRRFHRGRARRAALTLMTVGETGETIKLVSRESQGDAQALAIAPWRPDLSMSRCRWPAPSRPPTRWSRRVWRSGLGEDAGKVFAALEHLKGAPGRMEKVAFAVSGAPIYVDYAHTPDSLEKVLEALRPHTPGQAACRVRLRRRPRQGQAAPDGRRSPPRWPTM